MAYKLNKQISYTIFDDNVVVLDFFDGEFYLLDKVFIPIFRAIENEHILTDKIDLNDVQVQESIQELLDNNLLLLAEVQ